VNENQKVVLDTFKDRGKNRPNQKMTLRFFGAKKSQQFKQVQEPPKNSDGFESLAYLQNCF